MKKRRVEAVFERDENGYWSVVAQLGRHQSVISDGQTLPKARRRLREALAVHLDVDESQIESSIKIEERIKLPAMADRAIAEFKQAEDTARAATLTLERKRRKAAQALDSFGLSRRDSGDLLGVSGQRVQQIVRG